VRGSCAAAARRSMQNVRCLRRAPPSRGFSGELYLSGSGMNSGCTEPRYSWTAPPRKISGRRLLGCLFPSVPRKLLF
jgi:hypothetical protein